MSPNSGNRQKSHIRVNKILLQTTSATLYLCMWEYTDSFSDRRLARHLRDAASATEPAPLRCAGTLTSGDGREGGRRSLPSFPISSSSISIGRTLEGTEGVANEYDSLATLASVSFPLVIAASPFPFRKKRK